MPAQHAKWVAHVRGAIKQQHGFGWSVRGISGKVQLTRRYEDGTRSSVVLDLPWTSACAAELLPLVLEIRERMDSQQLGLKEAYELLRTPASLPPGGGINWPELIERFHQHKTRHTGAIKESTWQAMYAPVMQQLQQALRGRPIPRDARALLGVLRDRCGGAPGSRGRKLLIQYAAQFLRYAVRELGLAERWLPPEDLLPFVGRAVAGTASGGATPMKDEQLCRLLDGIPDPSWRLAVGLLGCFGLRPVELRYCRAKGDKLHVAYRKRTAHGSGKAGDVPGLDPAGMEGLSQELLALLESGTVELPPLGSTDRAAAMSVRQHLERREAWRNLKAEVAARGGKLTPYSFRHGYALRAHEVYDLSPRITAGCMRHSLQTHHQHYGAWTDVETIDAAIARGVERARRLMPRSA